MKSVKLKSIGIVLFLLFLTTSNMVFCQNSLTISGKVVDQDGEVLPFATLGVINKDIGTVSDVTGYFEIELPASLFGKTLTIRYVGYKTHEVTLSRAMIGEPVLINLTKDIIALKPVQITAKSAKTIQMGYRKDGQSFVWIGSQDKGAEISSLMNPKKPIMLSSVAVEVLSNNTKFQLLVNIYEQDPMTKLPGKQLLNTMEILEGDIQKGWVTVDMEQHQLVLSKPFFVAFRWIDPDDRNPQIGVNFKKNKSYFRTISLGKWRDYLNWNIRAEGITL